VVGRGATGESWEEIRWGWKQPGDLAR
jgi:hypothetical protein